MIPSNDNHPAGPLTITIESGDGDMQGLYLACMMAGASEPISVEIFGSKDEAYDFARDLLNANPQATFKDLTEGGDR